MSAFRTRGRSRRVVAVAIAFAVAATGLALSPVATAASSAVAPARPVYYTSELTWRCWRKTRSHVTSISRLRELSNNRVALITQAKNKPSTKAMPRQRFG